MKYMCIILTLFQGSNFAKNMFNSSDEMFLPAKRIIGGILAKIEDFPSTACLILKSSDGDDFRGGAAIISEYWALTAAHCMTYITDIDIKRRLARVRSNSARWNAHFTDHTIIDRVIHERYNANLTDFDVTLLKVKQPFKGPYEKPVKLASSNYKVCPTGHRSLASVVGWGTTDAHAVEPFIVSTLRFVTIQIMNSNTCKVNYRKAGELVTDRMICAGSPGKDACIYDSGGPLYQNNLLIGLVSWGGSRCADEILPGVYTKLSIFHQWINRKISRNLTGNARRRYSEHSNIKRKRTRTHKYI